MLIKTTHVHQLLFNLLNIQLMAGEGSMLLASALLKLNTRQQKHFIGNYKNTNGVYTTPVLLQKVSKEEQSKLDRRVQQLKNREEMRLYLVTFVIFILFFILMTKFFLH